jgi:hypothetical protein
MSAPLPAALLAAHVFSPFVAAASASDADALAVLRACRRVCKAWRAGVDAALAAGLSRLAPRDVRAATATLCAAPGGLAALRELALSRCAPPPGGVAGGAAPLVLLVARFAPHLTRLDLSDCAWVSADALSALGRSASALPCLDSLSLARCLGPALDPGHDGHAGAALRPLGPQLTRLDVSHSGVSPTSLLRLAPALRRLRELRAAGALHQHAGGAPMLILALDALAQHGTLTSLDLSHCPDLFAPAVEPSLLAVLPQFAAAPLRELAIAECYTQEETEAAVVRALGAGARVLLEEEDESVCGERASWAQAVTTIQDIAWCMTYDNDARGIAVLGSRCGAVCVTRCVEFSSPRRNVTCTAPSRCACVARGAAARRAACGASRRRRRRRFAHCLRAWRASRLQSWRRCCARPAPPLQTAATPPRRAACCALAPRCGARARARPRFTISPPPLTPPAP